MLYFYFSGNTMRAEYSPMSGIRVVLEYKCVDSDGNNVNKYVACPDDSYAKNWIYGNEYLDEIDNKKKLWVNNNLCWITRSYIVIDWYKDYHFYPDKEFVVVDTETKPSNICGNIFLDL